MPESLARTTLVQRLREAAEHDERIVGMVDYGSSSEDRLDEWSDIDVAIFIRYADFDAFSRDWKEWAARFGDLLLAYIGALAIHGQFTQQSPFPCALTMTCIASPRSPVS